MKYSKYFAIEKKLKAQGFDTNRSELIHTFTDGEQTSLKALSHIQYTELLTWLNTKLNQPKPKQKKDWQNTPENTMRRKIIALFVHQMGYSMDKLQGWCVKKGKFHKKLNDHSHDELVGLVSQAEIVHADWVKNINK
jgi:hypothetical protein